MPAMPTPPSASSSAFDQFLAAERQQESGGDYGVVNSIGAAGAYQIMSYHIPDWSKAALGHSISENEFLHNPAEQDAIARYEFKPIYDQYGPAGAAAWWYSGQTNPNKTYGNPPVYEYVKEVLGRIGKAGSVSGGTATQTDNTSGTAVHTAGLQQAGYDAQIDLNAWGVPLNPFKLPGWMAGILGGGLQYGLTGGDGSGGLLGGMATGMWDAVGPIILSGLGVAAGLGVILIGLYVTAKPAVDHAKDQAVDIATTAAPLAAV